MNTEKILDSLIYDCQISKFKNISESCNDKQLKKKSEDIINYFLLKKNKKKEKDYDIENYKLNFENDIEKLAYSRPWNKLHEIHKIIKMKEYVDKLNLKDKRDTCELKIILEEYIKNRKLNSIKIVDYDYCNLEIKSIKGLKIDNGLYEIFIK